MRTLTICLKKTKMLPILIILTIVANLARETTAIYSTFHMNTYCGSTINVDNFWYSTYGFIKMPYGYYNNMYANPCRFHIEAKQNEYIYVNVRKLDLRSCALDRLLIYDDNSSISGYLCGTDLSQNKGYIIYSGKLTVDFEAFPNNTYKSGFELIYTSYRASSYCYSDEFRCHSNKCIPKELKCDNIRNCHDGSDELDCPGSSRSTIDQPPDGSNSTSSTSRVIAIVAGAVVPAVVIIITVIVCCVCCNMFKKERSRQNPTGAAYSRNEIYSTTNQYTTNEINNLSSQVGSTYPQSHPDNSEAHIVINPAYDHRTLIAPPQNADLPPDYNCVNTGGIGVIPQHLTKTQIDNNEPPPPSYDEIMSPDNLQKYPQIIPNKLN